MAPTTASSTFTIDTLAATVTSVTPNLSTIAYANAGSKTFNLIIAFGEAMATTTAPTITFTPSVSTTLTPDGGSWTDSTHYQAYYNVAYTANSVSSVGVDVSGALDASGNAMTAYTGTGNFAINVANSRTYNSTDLGVTLLSTDTSVLVELAPTSTASNPLIEVVTTNANPRTIVAPQPLSTTHSLTIFGAKNPNCTITVDLPGLPADPTGKGFLSGGIQVWDGTGRTFTTILDGQAAGSFFNVNGGQSIGNGNIVVDNNLSVSIFGTKQVQLSGLTGNDTYKLNYSTVPVQIADTGGFNALDFSGITMGGITFDLSRDGGQAQWISPWNTTLAVSGQIADLTGTRFADTLTGGNAPVSIIRSGTGNDILIGGKHNSVLIGGGGNDSLYGGSGNNLLISGSGTCKLYGSGADNTLISGTTNYDAPTAATISAIDNALVAMVNGGRGAAMVAAKKGSVWAAAHPNQTPNSAEFVTSPAVAANQLFSTYGKTWICPGKDDILATLTATPVAPPEITSIPVVQATAGSAYSYQVVASSSAALTYSLGSGSPSGMTINASSGLISWPSANVLSGTYEVTVDVSNSAGSDAQMFAIAVS
jgi:hypothetical protein